MGKCTFCEKDIEYIKLSIISGSVPDSALLSACCWTRLAKILDTDSELKEDFLLWPQILARRNKALKGNPINKSVLFVEDAVSVKAMYKKILMDATYEVETAANGMEALKKLKTKSYDIIISDIRMSKCDGMELYNRAVELYPHMKGRFILTTGFLNDQIEEFFIKTKCKYLIKPFLINELILQMESI